MSTQKGVMQSHLSDEAQFRAMEVPLYEQVKAELRKRISDGLYRSGNKLPTLDKLATAFRVSAITIRRALKDLANEGALVVRQGVGIFVPDRMRIVRSFRHDFKHSLADDMRAGGVTPSFKKVSLSLSEAPTWVAEALGLRAGDLVYRLERVILGSGEPFCLDINYFTRKLTDALMHDLLKEFMVPVLVAHGTKIDYIDYRIEGSAIAGEEAALLRLPNGFPVLKVRYRPISPNGATIFTGILVARADRFAYEFSAHPKAHAHDLQGGGSRKERIGKSGAAPSRKRKRK